MDGVRLPAAREHADGVRRGRHAGAARAHRQVLQGDVERAREPQPRAVGRGDGQALLLVRILLLLVIVKFGCLWNNLNLTLWRNCNYFWDSPEGIFSNIAFYILFIKFHTFNRIWVPDQ